METKGFFQFIFYVIINVLMAHSASFEYLYYGSNANIYFKFFQFDIDFRRQNMSPMSKLSLHAERVNEAM